MFRNMSSEGRLSGGQNSPSTEHGVSSSGLDAQESSWIGLFSVLSRPALSLLQRLLPGRSRSAVSSGPADRSPGWMIIDPKSSFVHEENEFLRQLDDIIPSPPLTYLRCEHDRGAGLLEPRSSSSFPWLTAESLQEMGIQSAEEMDLNLCQHTQLGYFSSVRAVLSQLLLNPQEVRISRGKDWVSQPSRGWWGGLWGGEEISQRGLLSWAEEEETGRLCPHQSATGTKAAETAIAFVQNSSTLAESAGAPSHKNELALNRCQDTEVSTPGHQLSIRAQLSCPGAFCSEVAPPTPDHDNGYSSLEEEHFHMCRLFSVTSLREEQPQQELETAEETVALSMETGEEETPQEGPTATPEGESVEASVTPQCQNKAIAFIMGCPCSDDDSSQSESTDDDDDGFNSEGSSDLSEDEDDEASESDSEVDSEAERLLSSLCQSVDPYNPQNFTAQLHTGSTTHAAWSTQPRDIPASTRPRDIPPSTPPSSAQSSPASSPPTLAASPLLASSCSPPSSHDTWDDSTSASEADEAESFRLWSSFSCSSDPYSPFNFQAPLRTREPTGPPPRTRARVKKASQTPPQPPHHHHPAAPLDYREEAAEDRLDSGFSEPSTSSSQSSSSTKKVRFCDDVEEFFASCGEEDEDRRGPWEELARDRCRFLRRCLEVEQSIAYCLQPQHRNRVYQRLSGLYIQDA